MEEKNLEIMKKILRENACPFFSDEELEFYYDKNNKDLNDTLFECFMVKSEDTTLTVSGLSCSDTSRYFRRLAQRYRKNYSRNL